MDHAAKMSYFQTLAVRIVGNGSRVLTLKRGVSGTQVVVVQTENGGPSILKLGAPDLRNSIEQEVEYGSMLRDLIPEHIPAVHDYGVIDTDGVGPLGYMIMEYVGDQNLHDIVNQGLISDSEIMGIYMHITTTKADFWLRSRKPFSRSDCRRDYRARDAELRDRLLNQVVSGRTLHDIAHLPLIICGERYPSLNEILDQLQVYNEPCISVVSHGDLNGDNIVVNMDNTQWFFIDWEWTGRHDWRESVARMMSWWLTNGARLRTPATVIFDSDAVRIDYDLHIPELHKGLIREAKELARLVGAETQDRNWVPMVRKFIASYCLRDLRFQPIRSREEFFWPVFGEGVKALNNPLELIC